MNEIERLQKRIQGDLTATQNRIDSLKMRFAADPLNALEYSAEPLAWAIAELGVLRKIEKIISGAADPAQIETDLNALRSEMIEDLIAAPHQHQSSSIMRNAISEWMHLAQADLLRSDGKITRLIACLQQQMA